MHNMGKMWFNSNRPRTAWLPVAPCSDMLGLVNRLTRCAVNALLEGSTPSPQPNSINKSKIDFRLYHTYDMI